MGKYEFRRAEVIGSGSTSKVYKCHSVETGKAFAVKVMEVERFSGASLELLEREIQILRELSHPNIIAF